MDAKVCSMEEALSLTSSNKSNHIHNYGLSSIDPLDGDASSSSPTLMPTTNAELTRHLTLTDLLAIGIGGTIGSGFFVLTGMVAHVHAGPATICSWALSGLAACLSGCCYAELCAHIPQSGSAYMFTYRSLGELPAVWAAVCLSIEYIAASAAVARSWADKASVWILQNARVTSWIADLIHPENRFSIIACLLTTAVTLMLLQGVHESKRVTIIFTGLKIVVVTVMVVGGFYYTESENWHPFSPYGAQGVVKGAASTFFGYLGYDQVSCLAGEVVSPHRDLPRAILGVLAGVTTLYMFGSLALTGMVPYAEISSVAGFPSAFQSVGAHRLANSVALGELVTLPIVTLITIMAQPRLMYAMAKDGLLPRWFQVVDSKGNLWNGTALAGTTMIVVASVVPFSRINDIISCAVLTALNMTDTSLILLRHEERRILGYPALKSCVASFHLFAPLSSLAFMQRWNWLLLGTIAGMISSVCALRLLCRQRASIVVDTESNSKLSTTATGSEQNPDYFTTPLVPFWPCAAIWVNWCLILQLDLVGPFGLFGLLAGTSLCYIVHRKLS